MVKVKKKRLLYILLNYAEVSSCNGCPAFDHCSVKDRAGIDVCDCHEELYRFLTGKSLDK